MASLQIGSRVVTSKGALGTVAFIGTTSFASGKWIGIILDEPEGKNNGSVQGKSYFQCKENHGTFVRISHLSLIDEAGNKIDLSAAAFAEDLTPKNTPISSGLKSRFSSSHSSVSGKATPSRSREDLTSSAFGDSDSALKRASFVESHSSGGITGSKLKSNPSTPLLKNKTRIPMTRSLISFEKTETPDNSQTGFVENLKPQFTPGLALVSPGIQTQRPPPTASIDPVEFELCKSEVRDLTEKLETMKIKYKEKMHEIDAMRIKLDQAAEFKIKIMESQAAIQRELEQLRREKQEALEARDDMSDMADALEMATLDKEMAEEKVETLQAELAETKEKLEELQVDFEILKEELNKAGSESTVNDENKVANSYQMKQLEQQNLRYRETLMRMRDLSAHDKHEAQKLQKDLEEKKKENEKAHTKINKQEARIYEMEKTIADLHEQVDASIEFESMVEKLAASKLNLEDRLKERDEEIRDLEAERDMNDQLLEDFRELEIMLREDVDKANAETRQAFKDKENAVEALVDRELTIVKFRDLVHKLQDQYQDLQLQLQKESVSHDSMKMSIPEMLDFKKLIAETKAQERAIDLELGRMEVVLGQQHMKYLLAFMPDSFMTGGGDNDAVLTLILIRRLRRKCGILLSQLSHKFPKVELSNKGELVKRHTAEQYASRCRVSYHLLLLQTILGQFEYGLDICSTDVLVKTAASLHEMKNQERILDENYINKLKKDELDEKMSTEDLEKSVTYFNTMHTLLLLSSSGDKCMHHSKLLNDHAVAFITACDSIRTDVAIVQALIQEDDDACDMSPLCKHLATAAEIMQKQLKQVRRRVGNSDCNSLLIVDLATNLLKISIWAGQLTKALREIAKIAFSQIALTTDDIHLSSEKLMEISNSACEKTFDNMPVNGAISCLKESMNYFAGEVANIAQAVLEVEINSPDLSNKLDKEITAAILVRAAQVKQELEQTKSLQSKLETKDNYIKEMKLMLKIRQEEIDELIIRKDFAEKKLANSDNKLANTIRDYEMNLQKLQRKLDEKDQLMKRKETEFEETMDHLQADIDSLECEKGELKDKLKTYSKKVLIDGIVKNANASGGNINTGRISSPTGSPIQVVESPFLLNEIKALRALLAEERRKKAIIENEHYRKILDDLEPIPYFKQDLEIDKEILDFEKKVKAVTNDLIITLSLPKVVDVSKRRPGEKPILDKDAPVNHLIKEIEEMKISQKRLNDLKADFTKLVMKRKPRSHVVTDMVAFPTPETKKILEVSDPEVFGVLTLPCGKEFPKPCQITLDLSTEEANRLFTEVFKVIP